MRPGSWLTVVAMLVACSTSQTGQTDAGKVADAGAAPDAGAPVPDAGVAPDAGAPVADAGSPATGDGGPEVLATFDDQPVTIAVVGDTVYVALLLTGIESLPMSGGTPDLLVSLPSGSANLFQNEDLAFDTSTIFFSLSGFGVDIESVPIDGGTAATLATAMGFASGIAVDEASVYWVDQDQGAVMKVAIQGGTASTLASGLKIPAGLVLHGGTLFFTDPSGDLMSVSVDGGTVSTLVVGVPANAMVEAWAPGLAADDSNIYFSQCNDFTTLVAALVQVPMNGGNPTTLAAACAAGIAVDADNVYWVGTGTGAGTVNEVPIGGGATKVLASGQTAPVGPALDATSVYWGTGKITGSCGVCPPPPPSSNALMKIAK